MIEFFVGHVKFVSNKKMMGVGSGDGITFYFTFEGYSSTLLSNTYMLYVHVTWEPFFIISTVEGTLDPRRLDLGLFFFPDFRPDTRV